MRVDRIVHDLPLVQLMEIEQKKHTHTYMFNLILSLEAHSTKRHSQSLKKIKSMCRLTF